MAEHRVGELQVAFQRPGRRRRNPYARSPIPRRAW